MAPPLVVKVGDIVDAGPARLCSSRQNESVERLGLQRAEETLDDGIVPTVAFSAHAALDSVASQESSILSTRVLTGFKESSQHVLVGEKVACC